MLSDEQQAEILAIAEARSQMRDERPEEYRAAQLMQSLLDGVWFTPRDVSGEQGMHDFDLDVADGRTFAVEVTSDKSQTDTAFQSQVERINPLSAPGLAQSWHVLIASPGEDHTDQPLQVDGPGRSRTTFPASCHRSSLTGSSLK